jgi:hypothetical protein
MMEEAIQQINDGTMMESGSVHTVQCMCCNKMICLTGGRNGWSLSALKTHMNTNVHKANKIVYFEKIKNTNKELSPNETNLIEKV